MILELLASPQPVSSFLPSMKSHYETGNTYCSCLSILAKVRSFMYSHCCFDQHTGTRLCQSSKFDVLDNIDKSGTDKNG